MVELHLVVAAALLSYALLMLAVALYFRHLKLKALKEEEAWCERVFCLAGEVKSIKCRLKAAVFFAFGKYLKVYETEDGAYFCIRCENGIKSRLCSSIEEVYGFFGQGVNESVDFLSTWIVVS